jgi:hypothetical protein
LRQEQLSLAAQARSLMLLHRRRESNDWWKPIRWAKLEQELEPWLLERLLVWRPLIVALDAAVRQVSQQVEAAAPAVLPKGLGRLTHETVQTEVADWTRF